MRAIHPIPGTEEWERAVTESDLPLASDPLFHSGSIFPVRNKEISWNAYEDLKALAAELNRTLARD